MVNKVILIGHVGKDPEITPLKSGAKLATFRMATSEFWRDKDTGERRQATEWHSVVVFAAPVVETVERFVRKGSKLYVEGQNKTRKWTDRKGVERTITEIVIQPFKGAVILLDKAEREPTPTEDAYGGEAAVGGVDPATGGDRSGGDAGFDDEIPF